MPYRIAIWSAVSSQAQAKEDKVSIEVQIQRARDFAKERGWIETAGPYIVIASRTRWADLSEASQAIPDLALMLSDARAARFDLLLIFDYTRLRALLEPISQTISRYGIQILSISQPIEISGDRENASITEFTAAFISRAEISALKRRYRIGMPKRVLEKGLPKGTIPFGYRKPIGHETDRKAIPEQDPIRAAVVLQIKDLFLSGQSLWQIANQLTEQKAQKSRGGYQWTDVTVREILKNKFYAGEISYGKTRITHDPLTGTVRRTDVPPEQIQTASGAHIPLWGKDTAHEIEAQFQRRGKKYTGIQSQRLSGLLYCGICGARMWVQYPGGYAHERKRQWACNKTPSHLCIKDSDLLPLVITELTKELKNAKEIEIPSQQEAAAANQRSLQDHRARKARILEAYESSALTLDEYKTRIASLNAAIHELETKQTQTERIAIGIKKQNEAIAGFVQLIEEIPNYLTEAPAQRVNTQLRAIIQTITVHPATVKIQLRTQ